MLFHKRRVQLNLEMIFLKDQKTLLNKNKNHIGLVFLTNNSNSINIPSDDRRFVGVKCNSDICNDPIFFPKVVQEIKSKKYDRCFYDYLMSLNIDGFDFLTEKINLGLSMTNQ